MTASAVFAGQSVPWRGQARFNGTGLDDVTSPTTRSYGVDWDGGGLNPSTFQSSRTLHRLHTRTDLELGLELFDGRETTVEASIGSEIQSVR